MTADVNLSTSEMKDKCGLDMQTSAADCNCNGLNDNGKRSGEDDPGASYVFVSVADHSTHTADLNANLDPVHNVGSPEFEVDPVIGDVGSSLNNGVASNDEKEGNDVDDRVPNGTVPVAGPEVHALDGEQGKLDEDHLKLDSPKDVEQFNVSEPVEPKADLLQVNVLNEKAGEEHSMESNVTPESQVTNTIAVGESVQNQYGDVEEVPVSVGVAESGLNHSSNNVDQIEGERKLNLVIDTIQNQDSSIAIIEAFHNNSDSDQGNKPVRLTTNLPVESPQKPSEVELEQNIDTTSCLVAADVKLEGPQAPDASAGNEYSDVLSAGHAQDSVAETSIVNGPDGDCQNSSELSSSPKEVEMLISSNAGIGGHEAPNSSDAETGKSFPAINVNEPITNDITVSTGQLESEAVNGHFTCEKGENLPTNHAEESFSQTLVDFAHASRTAPEENKPSEVVKPVVHDNVAVESYERITVSPASDKASESVVEIGNSCPVDDTEKYNDTITETMVEKLDANGSGGFSSHPAGDREVESGPLVTDTIPTCPDNDAKPEIETDPIAIESEGKVLTFTCDTMDIQPEVSGEANKCVGGNPVSVDDPEKASVHDSIENPVDEGVELEVGYTSVVPRNVLPNDDSCASESDVLNGSAIANCIQDDTDGENKGDHLVSVDGLKTIPKEMEVADGNREEASTSSPEGSAVDASDGQNAIVEVAKRPFYHMIRIPRYDDDENLKEQIKKAQFQVDEKTKSRDVIRAEMQKKRANCNEYSDCLDAAKSEEIAACVLLKAKRKEIDSVLSVINRVKSAFSVEDIDGKIRNMEHMIQHETLPLKEEKNFIREIKQLKQTREQLISSLGNQEDVQEAIDQKDLVEERLKHLRKESDLLRENVLKAEAATKSARNKHQDEISKLNELISQFRAADDIRQEAYAHLQSLRKRLYDKNKYFWKYKDDAKAAYDLAANGNIEDLQLHCVKQVEMVMELWNNNDEFRKEYIRCNMRSTLRRLRTLDGRSLGPDEEPPVIPIVVNERVAKDNIAPSVSTLRGEKTVAPVEPNKTVDKSTEMVGDQNNRTVKSKKPAKHAPLGNGLATISGRNEIEEAGQEEHPQIKEKQEHKRTKEEEELARKMEELRKEKEAAMLKEQRRLEEKTKAKEAMERKKRNADKAQARAVLRAQKEAEQKEREREKKAKKKEKKKASAEEANGVNEAESTPISETPRETKESEAREKSITVTKRPQKPSYFVKQNKTKPMPMPLRNRGKRTMQTWMWVLLTAVVVFALFFMGNGGFSLKRLGF